MLTKRTAPYLFCAPFLITFVAFMLYPMYDMVYRSFYKLEGIRTYRFVGWDNYQRIATDPHIVNAIVTTLGFTAGIVVVNLALPLLLALVLNDKLTPFRNVFRSAFYIPALTSIVVAGIFFRLFLAGNPDTPLNALMQLFGKEPKNWLFDTKLTGIEVRMAGIEGRMTGLEGQMQGLKWMQGFVMAGTTALIVRTFFGP